MMDWLNDRKNLPIVGAITGVVVVAAVAMVYLTIRGSSPPPQPTEMATPAPEATAPTYPPTPTAPTPPAPSAPSVPPPTAPPTQETGKEQGAGAKVALLPFRADPFLPFDYKPVAKRPKPRISLPPIAPLLLPKELKVKPVEEEEVLPPQPQRRMAGVLYNGRVYAMLETAGDTIVVKPGDIVENGNVRVDAIEPNRILLSWLRTKKPIPIEVRMSEGTVETTTGAVGSPEGTAPPPSSPPLPSFGRSRRGLPRAAYPGGGGSIAM